MSKVKQRGRVMFVFICIITFIVSFAGSAVFKMTYTSPEMKKYTVEWSDEIGKTYTDLSYGEKPANKFDLYVPKDNSKDNYGLIVYLHAGGFRTGDKSEDAKMLQWLCSLGYVTAGINYTLNSDENPTANVYTMSVEIKDSIPYVVKEAEKLGYKKRVIYPKIENVALLYFTDNKDELEDDFYRGVREEIIKQAKKMNIQLSIYDRNDGMDAIPKDLNAFIAVGWLARKEINKLYKICKKGVFIGTSPDEKLFDAVKPNMDSFVTQMVDYFIEKGHKSIGFIGGSDRNIDTGKPAMDIREWSFRQSTAYYGCLNEDYILISEKFTVDDGYRMGKELLKKKALPTALCIASDTLAVGVLQALNEEGVLVPEQMAIFSINDLNIAKYMSPPLTTIHIDIPCICETALDLLRNRVLYGGRVTKLVFVNGIPIFRKSC